MTDIVDNVAQSYPVDIDNLVKEISSPTASKLPEASVRNQAALTALLSDNPAQLIDNYKAIRQEAEQGIEYTRQNLLRKAQMKQQNSDKQGLLSILADPLLDIDTKRAAIANLGNADNYDTRALVMSGAANDGAPNEGHEAESVRITGAEQWRTIQSAQDTKQQLINQSYAKASVAPVGLLGEVIEKDLAPFATNKMAHGVLNDILAMLGQKENRKLTAAMPGSSIEQIREHLAKMPPEDQKKMSQRIADLVNNDKRIIYTKDSQYIKAQVLDTLLGGREYGTVDKWLDNSVGVLDVFGVGSLLKTGVRKVTSVFSTSQKQVAKDIDLRAVVGDISPISPMQTVEHVNPDKARIMYSAIAKSDSDEVAKAMTGTTREKALIEPVVPQPATAGGNVAAKLVKPDAKVIEEITNTSAIAFTSAEREAIAASLLQKADAVQGIVPHDNMFTIGLVGNREVLKATYGTAEGGFLKADEAVESVKFSLAQFGINDSNVTLLKKVGDEYVPTTLKEELGKDGNYLVQVESDQAVRAAEVNQWSNLDVKRNWFDRSPLLRSETQGTPTSHMMPAPTMMSPVIATPAAVGVAKGVRIEKILLEMHDEFAKMSRNISADRRASMMEYIKMANYHGIPEENAAQLLARGFVKEEIQALQKFRQNWDTHWWLENRDANRTLANQGYQVMETAAGDRYFAKPSAKNIKNAAEVLDPTTNAVIQLDRAAMDALYNSGGTLAKLRSPMKIGNDMVEHIIARNTPNEYLRVINENDKVLEYLPNYYQVQYKDGRKFIYENVVVDGVERQMVREIAGSSKEAELTTKRLARAEGKPDTAFGFRDDKNELKVDTDAYWELNSARGRVAQRRRGERLESNSVPVGTLSDKYILNPLESAVRASASLSRRVAMRDNIEAMKARAIKQYGSAFPSDGMGGRKWVDDSNSLMSDKSLYGPDMADARTTVHYINYLENGYQNTVDDGFKFLMNAAANSLNKFEGAEKAFMWMGDMRPMSTLRSGVSSAFLFAAPVRQAFIQSHQIVRLLGYSPKYVSLGGLSIDTAKMGMIKAGYTKGITKADQELYDLISKSGLIDVVDRHNLTKGIIADMQNSADRTIAMAGRVTAIPRQLGFDAGEKSSKMMHALAVGRKYQAEGKSLADPNVRDEVIGIVDALTYSMSHAGDMPYNQNFLGVVLQFAQAPHKAITTAFDRRIPLGTRGVMLGTDLLMFGVPGALALEKMLGRDALPQDKKLKEAVVNGLVSISYNGIMSKTAGEEIGVNFESLSPWGMDGFAKFFHSIVTGNFMESFQNSPAFSLYFKEGGKLPEALQRGMKYLGFIDQTKGIEPETAADVMKGVAEIASGWNHATKAKIILETGKIPDKSSRSGTLMDNAHWWYAVSQAFGFTSKLEVAQYAALNEQREFNQKYKDDLERQYKDYSRLIVRKYETSAGSADFHEKMAGVIQLQYKGDYDAQAWFHKRLAQDMVDNQETIIKNMIKHGNIPTEGDLDSAIQSYSDLAHPDVQKALQLKKDMQAAVKQMMKEE